MTSTLHVLHVDDQPSFGELVAECLQLESDRFEVSTVTSPSEGFDILTAEDRSVDCVVSDYDMPEMNGIEFLERLREEYPELPFILFTGKGSEEVASDAISAGATDYLQKGRGTDRYTVLANRIQNAVEGYRSRRRADEHKRITEVVRNLNRALVYADSVPEIETEVCDILIDADPYVSACIAGVKDDRIEPRTWAGEAADYFDELEMAIDEGSPGRRAPGGRAYHDRETAVSQRLSDDPGYEQWREAATERGFQSLAVVPLEYNDALYGLLAVFADRPAAFDEREQELLSELGDDIAHAVNAQSVQADLRTRNRAVNEAPVGVTITDPSQPDNPIIYVNETFVETTGYTLNEMRGENHRVLQGPETEEKAVATLREAIDAEERTTVELRNYRKDGEIFWNRVSLSPVYDDDGHLTNFVGFQEDVTDRKEAERELRRNERRFEALFNDPNLLVGLLDIDGTVLDVNDTALEYIAADRDAVTGEPFPSTPWWTEDMRDTLSAKIDRAASGQYVEYETDLFRPDGDRYSVAGVIRPVPDPRGEVSSLLVSARDVTDT